CLKLAKLLRTLSYKEIVVGGWDLWEFWLINFLSKSIKNSVVIESASESHTTGLKGWIKKRFLSRVTKAYVSGKAQSDLLHNLKFRGEIVKTFGVGIFNMHQSIISHHAFNGRFLF